VDTQQHHLDGSSSQKLQAFSRELNERLYRIAQSNAPDAILRLLCECGHCGQQIEVEADAYERARTVPGRLLVKHGHEYAEHATDTASVAAGEAP
jgi:phosphate starvation-inducible protein PhoH